MGGSVNAAPFFDRTRLSFTVDVLAVAVAVSLPWSTSATIIFVVLWVIALCPTLDLAALRREIMTPAGGLPVALFAFGALGMLWADVPFVERLRGLDSFVKILAIPLLLVQFRGSTRGTWPIAGFLISSIVLLAVSIASALTPGHLWGLAKSYGVPVKDYIAQSGEFTLAAFGVLYLALQAWRGHRPVVALMLTVLALAFLIDIFYIASSRTTLVTIPILLAVFAFAQFKWKTMIGVLTFGAVCLAVAWMSSSFLRERFESVSSEIQQYQTNNARTSAGERLEFWKKAIVFIGQAPIAGHGTGTIHELYRRAAVGQTGVAAEIAANPHNQTFTIAIQLGLLGAALLYAMWLAHLLLFRGDGLMAWVGLVVVMQNVIGSIFNSHLFDFTQGWLYAFGVGIAGGAALAREDKAQTSRRPDAAVARTP